MAASRPLDGIRSAFAPEVTYLNTAVYGLPPVAAADAVVAAERARLAGRFDPVAVDAAIADCRRMFGELVGFDAGQVAIGAQVSQFTALVAATLPPDATVLVPEGEFTSVHWPLLARGGARPRLRTAPAADLPAAVRPGDDLVAASVVQSADGTVLDAGQLVASARSCGARVLLDVSQAAGWLPVHATGADWVVSVGHKWLLGPKGIAFLAGTDEALSELPALAAGWYAGRDPWGTSCYDEHLDLAPGARRLDVSPTWPAWEGARKALELLLSTGIDAIHRHDVALADRLRTGLGAPPGDSAIVTIEVAPDTAGRLQAAGIAGAMRNGRLRLSCHLYNTEEDVDRALDVLSTLTPAGVRTA